MQNKNELYHFRIKGMKWGVRRYQNKDGSLTTAGKKHYSNMSNDKLQKTLYKQVKKTRSKQSDWSNQWDVTNTIGKNSKEVQDKFNKDRKEYENSDVYKKAEKKIKDLDKRYDQGKISIDEYEIEHKNIMKSVYKPEFDTSVIYTEKGRKYSEKYLNTYGKDLNIAYLKDLGYDDKTAKEFTNRILKSNKKLLNGM